MAKARPTTSPSRQKLESKARTLGLAEFAAISAVEGVVLPPSSVRMFEDFAKRGVSPTKRRAAILRKHTPKT